tara:strand:+ start:233 stop:715 length:483 start_codon:yes stop_codon:yes gene_type:complete
MHSKNNSKSQSFIQGLRPFSSSIPKTLKKYLKKGGYNYSSIIDNWTKMVDKKISDVSYPITIKMDKEMKDGTLILNVLHGKELEIEYAKHEIAEKINSFFGYNCISHVKLKILQEKIVKKKDKSPKIKNIKKINHKMDKIENKQLKISLKNFLNAFNEKN